MSERKKEIIREQFFVPIFGEGNHSPVAPENAVAEYRRLQREWLPFYSAEFGEEPNVCLYPVKKDGITNYVVSQEITTIT